ncbi:MAG: hypothetical protein Q8O92_02985, partial [Candidatus Latescibacter sp.]|nr:hypothetical protein [Candidatus Latescibacter sp.]
MKRIILFIFIFLLINQPVFSANIEVIIGSIVITPISADIKTGEGVNFSAVVYDTNDKKINNAAVAWTVEGAIGEIAANGHFTAGAVSATGNVVASSGTVRATAPVTVTDVVKLVSIVITPTSADIKTGEKLIFSAVVYDTKGKEIKNAAVAWT